jgi:hypothetical protein
MMNSKKIDEKDFVFLNKTPSAKEEREFSNFLKARRSKVKRAKRPVPKPPVLKK